MFYYPDAGVLGIVNSIDDVFDNVIIDTNNNYLDYKEIQEPTKKQLKEWLQKLNNEIADINKTKHIVENNLQYY